MNFIDKITPEILERAEHKDWDEGEVYDTYEAGQPWNKGKKGVQTASKATRLKMSKTRKGRKHHWGHKIGEAQTGRRSNYYPDFDREGWVKQITDNMNNGMKLKEALEVVGHPEGTRHKAIDPVRGCHSCRRNYQNWKEAA